MEETIGALWDKLITKVAYTGFPHAKVTLEEMAPIAGVFFRALGGDTGLTLQAGTATAHGARLNWLQRMAGIGERVELSWADETGVYLPAYLDCFPQRELNRDLYLWLLALHVHDVAPLENYLQRNQKAACAVLEHFPALAQRYHALCAAHFALRPPLTSLKQDAAENELRIRKALEIPGCVLDGLLPEVAHFPVPLWFHPKPPVSSSEKKAASQATPEQSEGAKVSNDAEKRKRSAEHTDLPENASPFMLLFRAESLFSWAEYVKVNRALDEDDNPDAQRAAADLDSLSIANDGKTMASRIRFDLDLPSEAEDDLLLADGILYPEWHYKKQHYLEKHACIQMLLARDAQAQDLPEHLRVSAQRLRQQFQTLTPQRQRLRAQMSGYDIDIDACVRFLSERKHAAQVLSPGLYVDNRKKQRDLSCLLLADLSMSTDAWVSNDQRIVEVIRDSLFLLSEALDASRDRFALYGFSSVRRHHVRFHILKGFDEPYSAQIRGRLSCIKPGYYTRMGTAIRHAAAILSKQTSARRLLIILTDGKPNDLDQYEGRYGIEDTRLAIQEARQLGLIPFCVTIDEAAHDYLPHLFGFKGFVIVNKATELPQVLPRLYAQLTQE
jgi:nitric oxide reductase NorD protein